MFRTRQPRTFRRTVTQRVLAVVMFFIGFAAVVTLGMPSDVIDVVPTGEPPASSIGSQSAAEQRLERMIENGKCWTEEGPKGVIPGHAWFQRGSDGLTYGSSDFAFAVVFGDDGEMGTGDEADGRVSAFCL